MVFICCIPGCKNYNKDQQMHIFPKDPGLYNLWINNIGRADLKGIPKERVRKSYRVCNIHFAPDALYIGSTNKSSIKIDAVRSLFLPICANEGSVSTPPEVVNLKSTTPEFPSTSGGISTIFQENSTISVVQSPPDESIDQSTPKKKKLPKLSTPAKISNLQTRVNLLAYTKTSRSSELTPKARKLYRIASDLRKSAKKLNFNCTDLRKKVKTLESITDSTEFLQGKLNKHTYQFVMCQLRCQGIRPQGRRYSLDEKIFFLSLLKQSPKGYKLFRQLLAAPSRKTLTTLLNKIPFDTGINPLLLDSLATKLKSMKENDKLCSIIFDEMALDPTLQYNKGKDLIEGFQDNGGPGNRKPLFSEKVMVFMARGICRKWKQPLAYFFNEGGMKTDALVKTIKEVVISCNNAGLMVRSLICDQGAPNVAAINILYKETEEYFLRKGEVCSLIIKKLFHFMILLIY